MMLSIDGKDNVDDKDNDGGKVTMKMTMTMTMLMMRVMVMMMYCQATGVEKSLGGALMTLRGQCCCWCYLLGVRAGKSKPKT